ncbi:MAG: hypothetical protein ACQET1_01305 [Gemmatimonadota bacterium]
MTSGSPPPSPPMIRFETTFLSNHSKEIHGFETGRMVRVRHKSQKEWDGGNRGCVKGPLVEDGHQKGLKCPSSYLRVLRTQHSEVARHVLGRAIGVLQALPIHRIQVLRFVRDDRTLEGTPQLLFIIGDPLPVGVLENQKLGFPFDQIVGVVRDHLSCGTEIRWRHRHLGDSHESLAARSRFAPGKGESIRNLRMRSRDYMGLDTCPPVAPIEDEEGEEIYRVRHGLFLPGPPQR